MGKKKGRQQQDDALEQLPAPSSLGEFLDFPSLGGLSGALPDGSHGDSTAAQAANEGLCTSNEVHSDTAPSPLTPPELTAEELEARHKKEKRELEGAARAARKAAGKNKVKTEEADAAAEQAMDALRIKHARELLGFQLRPEVADPDCLREDTEAARTALVGIKEILAGPRLRDAVTSEEVPLEELRIDTSDGNAYPLSSFLDVYGDEEGQRRWAVSPHSLSQSGQPGRGNGSCVPYAVMGSKKGGFPVSVEKRSRGKTVRTQDGIPPPLSSCGPLIPAEEGR